MLQLDGPLVPVSDFLGVEVSTMGLDVHELSHSHVDLEDNREVITCHSKATSRLQTKSSLGLDSQYNTAFIQVQTVLHKRYISRYVS